MGLDRYLHQVLLHDCAGRVSHTLTLELDGSVRIDFADGRRAVVDPGSGANLTPGIPVPPALMRQAAQLGRW